MHSIISYRINDFCSLTGISRATFYREVQAGELSTIKVGKRVLIPANEVEKWLEKKAIKS